MARISVHLEGSADAGGTPIMMHNERLSDPLNPYTRWMAELTAKRKKTERDHEELARREFLGGGYWAIDEGPNGSIAGPVIPTWNVIRCFQEGAKRHKLGKHIVRALIPVNQNTTLGYDGPTSADELWKAGVYHSRKGVVISGRRLMRTRPCFEDWSLDVELELDLTVLDPDTLAQIVLESGRYEGLGDNRPQYGRFAGTLTLLEDSAELIAPDALVVVRESAVAASARATLKTSEELHASLHPNGKERTQRVKAR